MIFLTGDVHQLDSRMNDQKRAGEITEVSISQSYLEIANSYGIAPTLFFTGLAVVREWEPIREMMRQRQFEIGGHTYSANRARWLMAGSRRVLDLANGPRWYQKKDMAATLSVIRRHLGFSVVCWRNHAYRMDRNTYSIASELGVTHVSNVVAGLEAGVRAVGAMVEVPINTLPDHETLGHDSHPRRCRDARDWAEKVLEQVEFQQSHGISSVVLAHPLCMFIEDRFAAFEYLCRSLSRWPAGTLCQAVVSPASPPPELCANRH
jgi:hypothetical protein